MVCLSALDFILLKSSRIFVGYLETLMRIINFQIDQEMDNSLLHE